MNVLFITGSGRKDSITTRLSEIASSALPGAEISFIRPYGMHLEHCNGCGYCSSAGRCRIDDDMSIIYNAAERSDIVILATPVYFSGPSSMMKLIIDRFQCVWVNKSVKRKHRTAALITAGGQCEPVFSNTVSIAKAFAATVGAAWGGALTVRDTDGIGEIPEELCCGTVRFVQDLVRTHLGKV